MIWRPIPGWPSYEASDRGDIRRAGGRVLRAQLTTAGYLMLTLSEAGFKKNLTIHRLVCAAFRGPSPAENAVVMHKDGDRLNNTAANLRWGTYKENEADKARHGTRLAGARHHGAKLTADQVAEIRRIRSAAKTRKETYGLNKRLAERFGVSVSCIQDVAYGRSWAA